jgi:hypothetical protein
MAGSAPPPPHTHIHPRPPHRDRRTHAHSHHDVGRVDRVTVAGDEQGAGAVGRCGVTVGVVANLLAMAMAADAVTAQEH